MSVKSIKSIPGSLTRDFQKKTRRTTSSSQTLWKKVKNENTSHKDSKVSAHQRERLCYANYKHEY